MPNTGTADVGVVITNETATALEAREELRVIALDYKGAFNGVVAQTTSTFMGSRHQRQSIPVDQQ